MIRALTTSATGLQAQQANIERISNDLANVNTDGYKKSRTEFSDLMYETIKEPGAQVGEASQTPVGIQTGMGVKVGASHKDFEQGPTRMTYHPWDLMIEGKGFFPIQLTNGQIGYTRQGGFRRSPQGQLQTSSGAGLLPQFTIPSNAVKTTFSPNGEVKCQMPTGEEIVIGQVQLAHFQNEEGLMSEGAGVFLPSQASGPPLQGIPGENGMGYLAQGALEGSNVNIANSMVDMISTQRAYEMNTRVMSTADKMMEATIHLK